MADKLNGFWAWANGKKTAFGLVLLLLGFLAGWLPDALPAFGVEPALTAKILGGLVTAVGLLHKLYKLLYGQAPGDPIR